MITRPMTIARNSPILYRCPVCGAERVATIEARIVCTGDPEGEGHPPQPVEPHRALKVVINATGSATGPYQH